MSSKLRKLTDQLAKLQRELDALQRNQSTLISQIDQVQREIELEKMRASS